MFDLGNLDRIKQLKSLPVGLIEVILTTALVFPIRTNSYVVNELIDWEGVPDDPVHRMSYPHPDMLSEEHWNMLQKAKATDDLAPTVKTIRMQRSGGYPCPRRLAR